MRDDHLAPPSPTSAYELTPPPDAAARHEGWGFPAKGLGWVALSVALSVTYLASPPAAAGAAAVSERPAGVPCRSVRRPPRRVTGECECPVDAHSAGGGVATPLRPVLAGRHA